MCSKVFIFGLPDRLSYTFSFSCEMRDDGKYRGSLNPSCPTFGERQQSIPARPSSPTSIHLDIKALGWGGELRRDKFWIFGFVADEVWFVRFGWKKNCIGTHWRQSSALFERRIILPACVKPVSQPFPSHSASTVHTDPKTTNSPSDRVLFVVLVCLFVAVLCFSFFGCFSLNSFGLQNS